MLIKYVNELQQYKERIPVDTDMSYETMERDITETKYILLSERNQPKEAYILYDFTI